MVLQTRDRIEERSESAIDRLTSEIRSFKNDVEEKMNVNSKGLEEKLNVNSKGLEEKLNRMQVSLIVVVIVLILTNEEARTAAGTLLTRLVAP